MKSVGGTGLVIIGFVFLWLAITGRMDCLFAFFNCLIGKDATGNTTPAAASTSQGFSFPLPSLPNLPGIIGKQ